MEQHTIKPVDYDLLVTTYERFVGSSKSKTEREMRQACEDYANGKGLPWDAWKTMIVPKEEAIVQKSTAKKGDEE